jgi:hypothetical protein
VNLHTGALCGNMFGQMERLLPNVVQNVYRSDVSIVCMK